MNLLTRSKSSPLEVIVRLIALPSKATLNVVVWCMQVYGYQSLKDGSQSEQLVGRFAKRGSNLPIDGPPPVLASKVTCGLTTTPSFRLCTAHHRNGKSR